MFTCDHCKQDIDQYKDRWGDAKTQNDDGDEFTVDSVTDETGPMFVFKITHDDDIARHYHFTCACALLTEAIADAAAMASEP